ncbi:MAG: hypothetical protein JWQ71_1184 [Pedosphaera sp.]|nr:hypothetical protein [Pedosphaera sp.]
MDSRSKEDSCHTGMAQVVERNIRALLERREAEERAKGWQERMADTITRFTGSMTFVYIHLVIYGLWIIINLGWIPFIPKFDPTFVVLAMEASVEAIFLSTFVLITQNRMAALANKRSDLDLQISLLAEHEVTRLVQLVAAMGKKMGIEESHNPELNELARDVAPEKVLDTMEENQKRFTVEEDSPGG